MSKVETRGQVHTIPGTNLIVTREGDIVYLTSGKVGMAVPVEAVPGLIASITSTLARKDGSLIVTTEAQWDGYRWGPVKREKLTPDQIPEVEIEKSQFEQLAELLNREASDGGWRVTLEYDNYQDVALVRDGDGVIIGQCHDLSPDEDYDPDQWVLEQFRRAVRRAHAMAQAEVTPDPESKISGAMLILRERKRQIQKEGWTAEHDAAYRNGELIAAAIAYAVFCLSAVSKRAVFPQFWPWEVAWFKPSSDPVRNLEKAGALIAAEIDRLTRLE